MKQSAPRDVLGLAATFAVSGALHLIAPRRYESIVPNRLPARRPLVFASGLAELGCAAGLLYPATRRRAGLVSLLLLAAVYPANVQMAVDAWRRDRPAWAKAAVIARLPLQLPPMRTAYRAWRR